MAYFPQLTTGAVSQFPGVRRLIHRTVVNRQADGRQWKLADPGARAIEWDLELRGLTDAEAQAIESLFVVTEGRRETFTFLDPFDNLLRWSEDLGAAVWSLDTGLSIVAGVPDPAGGTRGAAATNSGAEDAWIEQTIEAPAAYRYCLSVWARAETGAEVTLRGRSTTASASRVLLAGPAWQLLEHSFQLGGNDETVTFGVGVAGGTAVELFGFQAEPQRAGSGYKKTTSRSGVYPEARFADDTLSITADGPQRHSCLVRIRTRLDQIP